MSINIARWPSEGVGIGSVDDARRPTPVWTVECHYCGFNTPNTRPPTQRCPKCGGSAWELIPTPGALLPFAQPGRETVSGAAGAKVSFSIHSDASQAYLILKPASGRPRVVMMRRDAAGEWTASTELYEGVYRYGFYIDSGAGLRKVQFGASEGSEGRLLVGSPSQDTEAA
jgi:hypothetical protein